MLTGARPMIVPVPSGFWVSLILALALAPATREYVVILRMP